MFCFLAKQFYKSCLSFLCPFIGLAAFKIAAALRVDRGSFNLRYVQDYYLWYSRDKVSTARSASGQRRSFNKKNLPTLLAELIYGRPLPKLF